MILLLYIITIGLLNSCGDTTLTPIPSDNPTPFPLEPTVTGTIVSSRNILTDTNMVGIWGIVWAPNGQMFATTSSEDTRRLGTTITAGTPFPWEEADKTIRLWRFDGTLLTTITNHMVYPYNVLWSPNSQMVAALSSEPVVHIWRIDGTVSTTLAGYNATILSIAWAPDGQTLSTGSADNSVRLWNSNGTLRTTFEGHTNYITSIAWAPDGQTLATGSVDQTIRLWRNDGTLRAILTGHSSTVQIVAWAPDGQTLASTSADGTVRLWNVNGTLRATSCIYKVKIFI